MQPSTSTATSLRRLPPFFDYKHRIRYFQQEQAQSLEEIQHPSVRECIRYLGIEEGLEVVHNADLPARSGLGSSSTFTVGMLHSLHTLRHHMPTKRELALQAIDVEQKRIGEAVGSQDQTAAAVGGLNHIRFNGVREIDVEAIISQERRQLQKTLLCLGSPEPPLRLPKLKLRSPLRGKKNYEQCRNKEGLDKLTNQTVLLMNLQLLNEQWHIKRGLTEHITSAQIDEIYETGMQYELWEETLGVEVEIQLFYALKRNTAIQEAQEDVVPFRLNTGLKLLFRT